MDAHPECPVVSHFMSEMIYRFLQYISTTSGFIVFVCTIAAGYAGIWFLFLFEPQPKVKKAKLVEEGETAEGKKKGEAAKAPQKQPAKEAAASKA